MREGSYLEIPGSRTHELPPLLVHSPDHQPESESEMLASVLIEAEEMLLGSSAAIPSEDQRKLDLALQLKERYKALVSHWLWGDSILEWIRQCEITFGSEVSLRPFLHPDVWPHASRASFVRLLLDKGEPGGGVAVEEAVGLRLTFRQPPPVNCVSNQFLLFLDSTIASSAYRRWSRLGGSPACFFPPDRFHFEILRTL